MHTDFQTYSIRTSRHVSFSAVVMLSSESPAPKAKLSRTAPRIAYQRLPLSFEPNTGQFDPQARYLSRGCRLHLVPRR